MYSFDLYSMTIIFPLLISKQETSHEYKLSKLKSISGKNHLASFLLYVTETGYTWEKMEINKVKCMSY